MAEERESTAWWHTATLLALIQNCLTTGSAAVSAADFHPFESSKRDSVINCGKDLTMLRNILCS